jgi:hypothetical protein
MCEISLFIWLSKHLAVQFNIANVYSDVLDAGRFAVAILIYDTLETTDSGLENRD